MLKKIFAFIEKVIDFSILAMLWFVTSIPIITMGASTTALYYCIHKVIYQDRGYVREYFRAFKDNFKVSTGCWIIQLIIGAVFGIEVYWTRQLAMAGDSAGNLWRIFIILIGILIAWAVYVYPYIARFENTVRETLKNTAIFAILNFYFTVPLFLLVVICYLFVMQYPIAILIIPQLFILGIHPIMEKIFRKYMSEEEVERENQWDQTDSRED